MEEKGRKLAIKLTNILDVVSLYSEILIAAMLVLIIVSGIGFFIYRIIVSFGIAPYVLGPETIRQELDIVLVIFIVIELFRIAIAYYKKEQVLTTVMEAAFVAIARKVILYEFSVDGLNGAISLALLITSIGIAFFFIRRVSSIE